MVLDSSDDSEEREFCVNNEPEDENIEEEKSVASNYSSDSEMEQNLLLDFATSHKRVADSDNESISSDILNRKKFKKKRLGLEPKNKVYFLELANERLSKTSDNTCAKLPSMTHQNLLEYLEYYEQKHLKLILQNEKYYEKDFKQWFFQLNHDGLCLVNEKSQNTLSQLSTIKNISLICSVDHQNSTLLWCQKLINLFRFSMIDLTTFKNYSVETSFENSLMAKLTSDQAGGSSGFNGLTLSGCQYVLKSLPKNSRKIFKEFLSHQINEMESKNNERFSQDNEVLESNTKTTNKTKNASYKNCGMNFETLYLICIEKFYASSRQVLQTILVEFKDHNLIVYSNSESNSNDNMGDDQNMVCPMDLENLKILYESID
ncbi:Origin recognition complex subunit 2 [Clydaea vesicula]|uniref:Origin recognition complex subunit 2 n=1 Tax=Clydaea vesicula TaxID=447962 RepID=A0AAD5TYK7_9FUNG|nr:Origin recognition complex subunit 2 [Clydaea vesicula]